MGTFWTGKWDVGGSVVRVTDSGYWCAKGLTIRIRLKVTFFSDRIVRQGPYFTLKKRMVLLY